MIWLTDNDAGSTLRGMNIRYLVLVAAIAAAVVLAVVFGGATPQKKTIDTLSEGKSIDEVTTDSSMDYVVESPESDQPTAGVVKASSPNDPDPAVRAENQGGAVQVWSAYDIAFEDNDPYSPLSQIHMQFKNQQRDESWAIAMESGIRGSINLVEATSSSITVEQVECRSTICEVAGFIPNVMGRSQPDPRDMFADDFGVGWWHGAFSMAVRQHSYEEEGIKRFLVIIANKRCH